jgi:acyl-CoA hydrolase
MLLLLLLRLLLLLPSWLLQEEAGQPPQQRPPSDSYLSITYPFTSNELLRDQVRAVLSQAQDTVSSVGHFKATLYMAHAAAVSMVVLLCLSCKPSNQPWCALLADLLLQYQRFSSPFLRVGLLLEDMDSFAADVATRHLGGLPHGYTVVTATVDNVAFATARAAAAVGAACADAGSATAAAAAAATGDEADLRSPPHKVQRQLPPGWGPPSPQQQQQQHADSATLQSPLTLHSDLRLAGQVAWAGRTSMEVVVEVSTAVALPDAAADAAAAADGELDDAPPAAAGTSFSRRWLHRAIAHFIMVLRPTGEASSSSAAGGQAAFVPAVAPGTELERLHFDAGEARTSAATHERTCANAGQARCQPKPVSLRGCILVQVSSAADTDSRDFS